MYFRRLRAEASLAAPAEQVLVRINQAGRDQAIGRINDVEFERELLHRAAINFANLGNAVACEQHRLRPTRFGRINLAILDQCQHASMQTIVHCPLFTIHYLSGISLAEILSAN